MRLRFVNGILKRRIERARQALVASPTRDTRCGSWSHMRDLIRCLSACQIARMERARRLRT